MSLTTEEVGTGHCGLLGREPLAVSVQIGTGGPGKVMFELESEGGKGVDSELWGLAETVRRLSCSGREMMYSTQGPSGALSALCELLCR